MSNLIYIYTANLIIFSFTLTLLHSEWPKLYGVLVILSAIWLIMGKVLRQHAWSNSAVWSRSSLFAVQMIVLQIGSKYTKWNFFENSKMERFIIKLSRLLLGQLVTDPLRKCRVYRGESKQSLLLSPADSLGFYRGSVTNHLVVFKWQISICHFSLASAFSKHFRLTLPLKNESAQNAIHFLLNCRVSFNKSIFSEESLCMLDLFWFSSTKN